jgi:hypothetical protein
LWLLSNSSPAIVPSAGEDGENVPVGEYEEEFPTSDHTRHPAVTRHDGTPTDDLADLYPEEEAW